MDGQTLSSDASDPKEREEAFIMAVLFGVGKGVNERSENMSKTYTAIRKPVPWVKEVAEREGWSVEKRIRCMIYDEYSVEEYCMDGKLLLLTASYKGRG